MSDDFGDLQIPVKKLLSGSESHHVQQMSSSSSSSSQRSSHSSTTKTTSTRKSSTSSVMTVKKSTVKTSSSTTKGGGAPAVQESSTVTSIESSTKATSPLSIQEGSTVTSIQRSTQEGHRAVGDGSSYTSFSEHSTQEKRSTSRDDLTDVKSIMSSAFDALDNPASIMKNSSVASLKEGSSVTVKKSTQEGPGTFSQSTVTTKKSVVVFSVIAGTQPFDMTASVKSPSGVTELCDVKPLDDSHYSIKFVPHEMGVHTVSVKHKDMHIPGSPFEFTVGPIAGGGSHKVHAAGPGLERGEVDVPNEFNIYTREAGAGGLSIAVEGPSKAEIEFQDKKDGSCNVAYRVSEPGEYYVSVKFNDEHIPDSPFRVNVTPSIGDARKLSVQQMQDRNLEVGKPAAFVVNFNGAKGRLNAKVVSPSGAEEEALVQEIDDGQYAVRFIPRENGVHLVHVLFDNYHIPGSPFKVVVGKVDADAGKVTAYGDGLRTGRTGQVAKFIVNTVNAGSGSLAVTVEGPSKVKLECKEVDEGYEFSYRPTAPGDYLISIKYAGVQIAGSPFKAKIEGQGQPSAMQEHASVVVETVTKTSTTTQFRGIQRFQSDASKVTAKGAGLTKAVKGKTATFTVDASRAGNNMMFVGMMGPKGPCEELIVKHQGNLQYNVQYMVRETGRYMLIVRWGEDDIPGSPFAVEVQ
ncbi:filamin-C [Elysia marginata]|uniref:Filamin-C n=1 Tax=Elysia marginata TaxID=1093978 RepID=A0AAV4FL00_9GAST|nr:filamin-C [Elysia marginata]